ncbi:hypothetical protein Tco_0281960 [Tanacetum coccineum]
MAMSSAKAEYVAAAGCCAQVLWIKSQLAKYDVLYDKVPIFCDNTSAIAISNNLVLHSRTKYIDIRYHFIRDQILKGDIELHFVPNDLQLADIFTKPLAEPSFTRLVAELAEVEEETKTITFLLSWWDEPLSFTQKEFISAIRLPICNNPVPLPPKETIRAGLETLGLFKKDKPTLSSTVLVNSSPLKMKYFSPIWKLFMQYIVKCLGGMHGSHDQMNLHQQTIAYCLIYGLEIDIKGIIFSNLVHKLQNRKKNREYNICYTRASEQPVTQPKAPTDLKTKKNKIPSSSQPKSPHKVRVILPKKQVVETQHAEVIVATADTTKSLEASDLAEEQGNQPLAFETKKEPEKIIEMEEDVEDHSMEIPTVEQLLDEVDKQNIAVQETLESPYDTESEIEVSDRFARLETKLSKTLKSDMGKSVTTLVKSGMKENLLESVVIVDDTAEGDKNKKDKDPNPTATQGEPQSAEPLVESKGEQPTDLNIVNKESAPPTSDAKLNEEKELVVHSSEKKKSKGIIAVEDDSDEDDKHPLSKRFKIMTPIPDILNLTPLNTFVPEHLLKPKEQQKYSSKGKAVAIIEEPGNELVKYQEEGGFNPKMPKLKSFITPKGPLSQEEYNNQIREMKRLNDLKAELEKSKQELRKLADTLPITKISYVVNSRKEATIKITRGDNPLNLVVHSNFRLKTLGFSEWLEVHALTSKKTGTLNNLFLQSLRAKFQWVINQAKRLGLPSSPELTTFGVDGMDRNLIPPSGIMPIQGVVINEPESGIFFMNGNTDIGFQRESEFHLTPTIELIRLQKQIKVDSEIAREMFSKMNYVIEARSDYVKAREIVENNLDNVG